MEVNKNRQLFLRDIQSIVNHIYYSTQKRIVSPTDLAVARSKLNEVIFDNASNDKESNYEYLCLGLIALAEGDYDQAEENFNISDTELANEYLSYIDSYNYSNNEEYEIIDQDIVNSLSGIKYKEAIELIQSKMDEIEDEQEFYKSSYPYLFNELINEYVKPENCSYDVNKFIYIQSYDELERVIGYRKEDLLDDSDFPAKYRPFLNLVDKKYFQGLENLKNVIDNELEKYNKNSNELKKEYNFHK